MGPLFKILLLLGIFYLDIAYSQNSKPQYQLMNIEEARYSLHYDLDNKKLRVESQLSFKVEKPGYTVFDLVPDIESVQLNGEKIEVTLFDYPDSETKVRLINKLLQPGNYDLQLNHYIKENTFFQTGAVDSYFKFLDMTDRYFLERYLPTSFESDFYKSEIKLKMTGGALKNHKIITNGQLKILNNNTASIIFSGTFSSSSFYFHIFPKKDYKLQLINYNSLNGRRIPVTMYIKKSYSWLWSSFKWRVFGIPYIYEGAFIDIEKKYGSYPFSSLIILLTNKMSGGMEYVAAFETSHKALNHELLHNYFGRSIKPINGQVGWVDEAITTWNDLGFIVELKCKAYEFFKVMSCVDYYKKILSGKHIYTKNKLQRRTNRASYVHGKNFLSYVNYLLKKKSKSLEDFLIKFYDKNQGKYIKEQDFQKSLEAYYGESLQKDFDEYIY